MSQETKESALTLMLFPREVAEATSRQNWMREVRWGTTIPTSHSTSSSNNSIASHALSYEESEGGGEWKGREGREGGGRGEEEREKRVI